MNHRKPEFEIIERTICGLAHGAPAQLTVRISQRGNRGISSAWEGTTGELAESICTALYGRGTGPVGSPLAQAEAAKSARDLAGELGALMDGDDQLRAAPWYPLRPGDLVHIAMEQVGDIEPWGETYAIGEGTERGQLWMRLLHHSPTNDTDLQGLAGAYAGCSDEPLYEAWFEAGPERITVIRDGAVIPNQAGRR